MTDRILLNYVEQVYKLESEQYTLTQIIERFKQECSVNNNQIQAENVNYNHYQMKEEKSGIGDVVKIGFGILVAYIALDGLINADSPVGIAFFSITAFFLIGSGISGLKDKNNVKKENARKRQEAIDNADRELESIKKRNKDLRITCAQLETLIREFEKILSEKKQVLQHMYDYDIIHRSYRNFYGISKIYHLLDTGICDSLTGVNGAYSQMRTDQIIDNQKISIELQKNLLSTNQMMYSAINRTNDLLKTMNQQINNQNASNIQLLQDIRNNVEVSNFLIQSGNDDRKALAASAEYLAYAEKQKRLADGHFY